MNITKQQERKRVIRDWLIIGAIAVPVLIWLPQILATAQRFFIGL